MDTAKQRTTKRARTVDLLATYKARRHGTALVTPTYREAKLPPIIAYGVGSIKVPSQNIPEC